MCGSFSAGTALLMCVYYAGLSLFIFKAGLSLLGLCVFTRITLQTDQQTAHVEHFYLYDHCVFQ